jgi:uncharacterized membrane protein
MMTLWEILAICIAVVGFIYLMGTYKKDDEDVRKK